MLPGGVVVRIQGSYRHNQGLIPGQGSLSSSSLPATYQPPPCDHTILLDFPGVSDSKECSCNAGDLSLIPGLKDPLEKGKATHSNILAWRSPWTVQSMGLQSWTPLSYFHFTNYSM